MTDNEKDFIKNIRDYFGIEINEVDERRICFYLTQFYDAKLGGPRQIIIPKEENVIRYIYRTRVKKVIISDDEIMQEAISYCRANKINKTEFLMPPSKMKIYNRRTPTSIVKHRIIFSKLIVDKGGTMTQLGILFKVHHTTALYYIDPISRKCKKRKSAA